MDDGWIKLHRKMREWQHYQCPSVRLVFEELLFCANSRPKYHHGKRVGRGETMVSLSLLSEYTGFDRKTVVNALKILVKTGEIKRVKFGGEVKTSIVNFSRYQSVEDGEDGGESSGTGSGVSSGASSGASSGIIPPPKGQSSGIIPPVGQSSGKIPPVEGAGSGASSGIIPPPPPNILNKNKEYSLTRVNANARTYAHEKFIKWLEAECPYLHANIDLPTPEQLEKLKAKYGTIAVAACCQQIENRKDLRKKYKNLYLTLNNWLKRDAERKEPRKDAAKEAMTMQNKGKDYYDDGEEW